MDHKAEFAKRLSQAMQDAGYASRAAVLEREFNQRYLGAPVTLQAVRRWLRGEALPSQDKLNVLAEWLKVEPQILRYGESVVATIRDRKQHWDNGVDHQVREVFEAFSGLPKEQQKLVSEIVYAFTKANATSRGQK